MKLCSVNRGFSLVELSIVLVILGLLTGGILTGQSLIRASEMRAATAEYQRHVTAVQTFRDKYFALPGDMPNATRFWGRQVNQAWCVTNSSAAVATPGSCDGDGNGILLHSPAASQSGEIFQFWRQLAQSGLMEGSFTGNAGSLGSYNCVIGTNCPASKMNNAGWSVRFLGSWAGDATWWWAGDYGNFFMFGGPNGQWMTEGPLLRPEEAWNIDTKLDDGRPGVGRIWVLNHAACTNATGPADYAATYDLADSNVQCSLVFQRAF
jgi:prepilin-type N-terminal cleavage/methylation domain-containing protein